MEPVEDGYVQKIKIVNSIENILNDENAPSSLKKLPINEICKRAGISRATFYRHFSGIFDVVQWHFNYISTNNLYLAGRSLTWFEASLRNSIEHEKHRAFYVTAFHEQGMQSLVSYAQREWTNVLVDTITNYKHISLDEELVFQIDYTVAAESAMIARWASGGMQITALRMAELTSECIPNRLHEIIDQDVSKDGK